jgi:putative sterol carrier protein
MSEVATIFAEKLPARFQKGRVRTARTFYFSLGDEKWTVRIAPDACRITPEKAEDADVFFKGSRELFLDIVNGRYKPGLQDFLNGKIRSNNPMLLREFLEAFDLSV